MATLDTSGGSEGLTQAEAGNRREVAVRKVSEYEIVTGAQFAAGSVPSGLPEVAPEGIGYVFRLGAGTPLDTVTITIDTQQLAEQARVRKVNQAIRRARRT